MARRTDKTKTVTMELDRETKGTIRYAVTDEATDRTITFYIPKSWLKEFNDEKPERITLIIKEGGA